MAFSTFSKTTLILSATLFITYAIAHDFSIVGYSPEHLASMDKTIELFESWMSKHSKTYRSIEEKLHRFEIFIDNLKHIDETNKKVSSYWLGLNEFADLSHEEFKSKYLGLKVEFPRKRSSRGFSYRDVEDLPESVDWRSKGAVTPVKNQGSCGLFLSPSIYFYLVMGKSSKYSYMIFEQKYDLECRELLGIFDRGGSGGDKPNCHWKSNLFVRTRIDRL